MVSISAHNPLDRALRKHNLFSLIANPFRTLLKRVSCLEHVTHFTCALSPLSAYEKLLLEYQQVLTFRPTAHGHSLDVIYVQP